MPLPLPLGRDRSEPAGRKHHGNVSVPVGVCPPQVPLPPQPPGSNVATTEFGLDLGNASTVEALRTAWAAALRRHGPLLEG